MRDTCFEDRSKVQGPIRAAEKTALDLRQPWVPPVLHRYGRLQQLIRGRTGFICDGEDSGNETEPDPLDGCI